MAEAKRTCFIITPIGEPGSEIRRHIDGVVQGIKDAIGDQFDVTVAHEMHDIGSISRQVLEQIYTCDLAIANLTNLNPNVMYELAFRHAVGRPVIVIAEMGTPLPFDVKDERVSTYINDYSGIKALGETLRICVIGIDFEDTAPRSPIHDLLTEFRLAQQVMSATGGDEVKELLKLLLQKFELIEKRLGSVEAAKPMKVFTDFPNEAAHMMPMYSYAVNAEPLLGSPVRYTRTQPYSDDEIRNFREFIAAMGNKEDDPKESP